MKKKVAIVGYGLTEYRGESRARADELIFNASRSALKKARITREEIDSVVVATVDAYDGITISNGLLAPAAGAYNRDSIRLENGGGFSIVSAYTMILGGFAQCIVVASGDAVTFDAVGVSNKSYDPFFRRPVGLNYITAGAMLATKYMNKCNATEEDYALAAAKNYKAAAKNPYAHIKKGYSVAEILSSPMISWPLHLYETCPISYGAAALVLASEEKAKQLSDSPVWITGCGMGSEPYFTDWDEVVQMPGLQHASQAAFKMAGIKNPSKEINVAEVFDLFSPLELMEYEALGFCDEGEGKDLLRQGVTSVDGTLPVNVSGGAICTNGLNSGGLFRTIQTAMYLKNELSGLKNNARTAVVCDSDLNLGVPGETHVVLVLEKGD